MKRATVGEPARGLRRDRLRTASLWIACLLVLRVSSACGAEPKPRPSNGKGGAVGTFKDASLDVNGTKREYRLVVPKSVDGSKPRFLTREVRLENRRLDKGSHWPI